MENNNEKNSTTIITFVNKTTEANSTFQENNTSENAASDMITNGSDSKASAASLMAEYTIRNLVEKGAQLANANVMYDFQKSLSLNDDYITQRNYQIAIQQIDSAMSVITSTISGAQAGLTFGGPIGAAIGAAIGGITSVATIAYTNWQQKDQQDTKLRIMDAELDFTRQRAGWSTQAASIGEDL